MCAVRQRGIRQSPSVLRSVGSPSCADSAPAPIASASVATNVLPPALPLEGRLLGFDVVVFGDYLEHSPLSCNDVASTLPVNKHCLMDTLEAALNAINSGAFGGGCEEGVYKIFSVSLVQDGREARREPAS